MAGLTRGAVAVSAAVLMLALATLASAGHDYGDALSKSILFFEAQRSGYLPPNQRVKWRADSGLRDGKVSGVDLVGGYYDAGDNVKFGLPMAFTVTMMSWSILEYGRQLASAGELGHATAAVRWGTDYLIKAHPEPYVLYGEVGDGNTDHYCWQRPEDMTTSRAAYRIDVHNPGSDLAGETAAAMAAASLVFRRFDPAYSAELLTHAKQLFEFADKYRGKYDSSITVARKYYGSFSGYADELLWASAWLYQATNQDYYLDYLVNNADALGGTGWSMTEFGWDVKYAGAQILASKFLMQGRGGARHAATLAKYQRQADFFTCACLGKGTRNVRRTPGGLLFRQRWNNMQFVTSASFLLTVYSDYMTSSGRSGLRCASGYAAPAELVGFARSQVDYILGDNPRATSYMVGYGANYPKQVHHRGSSIVSIKVDPSFVSCRGGYDTWYGKKSGDPNLLVGALVGGPDAYDDFADERDNFEQTEPATYNNAPVLGLLARLAGGHDGYNQLLPDLIPAPVSEMPPPAAKTTNPIPVPKSSPLSHAPAAKLKSFGAGAVTVEQKVTASWSHRGKTYYRYSTIVSNNSPDKPLKNLQIDISKLYGPVWGLTGGRQARGTAGGRYRFPQWLDTLPAGKSMEFVYIHAAPQAQVSVAGYTLG